MSNRYDLDPRSRPAARTTRTTPWAMLAILALLILGGFMFYNSGGHGPARTAGYNTPSAASGPVAPGAPVPGPTSTVPAPNR
jgi:hypothetical protein